MKRVSVLLQATALTTVGGCGGGGGGDGAMMPAHTDGDGPAQFDAPDFLLRAADDDVTGPTTGLRSARGLLYSLFAGRTHAVRVHLITN